ncbi:MAG TPA: hypothetical protein VM364_21115 [Vicinamibacterales bacterium]|nr:hypothetical protein [Vicinamibacterales bacterium]
MKNPLQTLTLRRTAALTRLAALQKRSERLSGTAGGVVTAAITEFTTALDNLQVATDYLQAQSDETARSRQELHALRARFSEFVDVVPVPCIWTTAEGDIDLANPKAADALNVAASRLSGRPFPLFIAERDALAEAMRTLDGGIVDRVELKVTVRPRERRPAAVRLLGRRLRTDSRRCWFLLPPA